MNVRVAKRAQAQIDRAAQWWDENRDLAPEAFDDDLAKAFLLLSTEPGARVGRSRRGRKAFASRADSLSPYPSHGNPLGGHLDLLVHKKRSEATSPVGRITTPPPVIRLPQKIDRHMVQQVVELQLPILLGYFPHTARAQTHPHPERRR